MTRFEKARIIGARALQIALGAPIIIKPPPNVSKPVDIAILEFERGNLPITIRRRLPDGTYKDIPLPSLMKEKGRGREEKRR